MKLIIPVWSIELFHQATEADPGNHEGGAKEDILETFGTLS